MRNITGLTISPASDYAESGCKGTTFLRIYQIFMQKNTIFRLFPLICAFFFVTLQPNENE